MKKVLVDLLLREGKKPREEDVRPTDKRTLQGGGKSGGKALKVSSLSQKILKKNRGEKTAIGTNLRPLPRR